MKEHKSALQGQYFTEHDVDSATIADPEAVAPAYVPPAAPPAVPPAAPPAAPSSAPAAARTIVRHPAIQHPGGHAPSGQPGQPGQPAWPQPPARSVPSGPAPGALPSNGQPRRRPVTQITGPTGSTGSMGTANDAMAGVVTGTIMPVAPRAGTPGTSMSAGARPSGAYQAATGDGQADSALPRAGARIHQYEVIRELGRGGMGAVYLARDMKLGRRVAIKFLQSDQKELTQRFEIEARATAQLTHENIVIIHEVGAFQGNPFMVLEYLQGVPLTQMVKGGQKLPPSRAVEIITAVVRALIVAHEHDIVHRDLKPDNIFVTDSGTVKVLDFGIAKLVQSHEPAVPTERASQVSLPNIGDPTSELTRHGALLGTIPFMSPEQWMGMGVDHQTDIWAVGILLFMMLSGQHPLAPLRGQQLMVTAYLDEPMPRLRDIAPGIPDGLAAVVDRCLVKPKEQRMRSAKELLRALEPFLPGRTTSRSFQVIEHSPYAGLSSFQEADADRFFGRNRDIAAMITRMRDQPLVGVVAPSGVGKSSFVRAGVVPALKHSGEAWETLVIRPGRNPLAALAAALTPLIVSSATTGNKTGNTGNKTGNTGNTGGLLATPATGSFDTSSGSSTVADEVSEQQIVLQRLYREPGFLGTVLRSRARRNSLKILLFVDQFEELYTLIPDVNERMAFTACLAGVADDAVSPLRVVLSIRSDFLDRVAEDPYFMGELSQGLFFLSSLNRDSLREAIVQPAEMAGFTFESPNMVEHMLDTLESTPGALPLLQFTASKLWDARDVQRRLLSEQSYLDMGGVSGALASHADAVMAELTPQARVLLRSVFLRLVTPERTRAIASVAELRDMTRDTNEVQRLVDHLVQARLLVVQTGAAGEGPSVEIVHESLIHSWPALRRWLDENQDDAAFLDQLRTAARQWDAKGRPAGLLWRGEAMEEAWRWHRRYRGELPMQQQEFLRAVFALRTRSTRVRRGITIGIIGVLTVLVVLAGVALVRIRESEQAARASATTVRQQLDQIQSEKQAREQAMKEALASQRAAEEAQQKAEQSAAEAERSAAEAERANSNLVGALENAKKATRRARKARKRAKQNELEARLAELEAKRANEELEEILARERERINRLEGQLGSPLIEDLK